MPSVDTVDHLVCHFELCSIMAELVLQILITEFSIAIFEFATICFEFANSESPF